MNRRVGVVSLLLALLALAAVLAPLPPDWCPQGGVAPFPNVRRLAVLKNRVARPEPQDVDRRVTLAALLAPGDDRLRWSEARAAVVEGYVVGVSRARPESANCLVLANTDTHIHVGLRPDAPERERFIVEVTPRLQEWARGLGRDWSAEGLQASFVGRWCRIEGWLMFDSEHDGEAEHTAPGRMENGRATAWELHPVTTIEITSPR